MSLSHLGFFLKYSLRILIWSEFFLFLFLPQREYVSSDSNLELISEASLTTWSFFRFLNILPLVGFIVCGCLCSSVFFSTSKFLLKNNLLNPCDFRRSFLTNSDHSLRPIGRKVKINRMNEYFKTKQRNKPKSKSY